MTEVAWPSSLVPQRITAHLTNRTRSGTVSLSGFTQTQASLASLWSIELEFNTLKEQAVLDFRAMIAALRGRQNTIRVPIWDKRMEPKWYPKASASVDNSTRELLSAVTATAGDSEIDVNQTDIHNSIHPGHYIQIDGHCYMVTTRDITGSISTLGIEPAIRADVTGADLGIRPSVLCRLTDDSVGTISLFHGQRGAPGLSFLEEKT